jgi:predicted translin family RNA/ssDNA-binding protein
MTDDLDVLGLLRKYENTDKLKKQAADEIERLRAEVETYKDLYASEIVEKAVRGE